MRVISEESFISEQTINLGFLNGLHYKRYGTFGAFRTSIGLTRYEYEDRRGCPTACVLSAKSQESPFTQATNGTPFSSRLSRTPESTPWLSLGSTAEKLITPTPPTTKFTDNRSRRGMGLSPVLGLHSIELCHFIKCQNHF